MKREEKAQAIKAELEFIQNEIDRRHERMDNEMDRLRQSEKIAALREKKNELKSRLEKLGID
ncbi:MAG: hypothetical protein AAF699_09265 [Pseudomonadota bacterium]